MALLGMGNPLLDMSAKVDPSLLSKYDLKANDAILYEKEDIFNDMKEQKDLEFIAGGATQNSIRVAQWILGANKSTVYFGCVGKDETSQILAQKAKEAGVNVKYQYHPEHPTGKCAVLITGQDRSLVTKLDAANHYTLAHLEEEEHWKCVEEAKVYYSAGFFLTVCPDAMLKVSRHAADNDKIYALNLSAPFLCQFFKEPMLKVLAYADIVFGNETEAEAFAEQNNFGKIKDRKLIAKKIASFPKENGGKARMVVITQGALPVIVVENGIVTEYEVDKLSADKIVDTNGAGDAFVGGFLAQLVKGSPTEKCVKCGIWASSLIIQRSGCTFPEKMEFNA